MSRDITPESNAFISQNASDLFEKLMAAHFLLRVNNTTIRRTEVDWKCRYQTEKIKNSALWPIKSCYNKCTFISFLVISV